MENDILDEQALLARLNQEDGDLYVRLYGPNGIISPISTKDIYLVQYSETGDYGFWYRFTALDRTEKVKIFSVSDFGKTWAFSLDEFKH